MIITVTANPALDLTWHVDKIVAGGTHRADAGQARAGGKGLNVARVAHAEGAMVRAITTVGGATGEEFADELTASGVPHVLVPVAASTRRSIALVDESLGDTTIINERGVAPTASEWDALKAAVADALRGGAPGSTLGADTPDVGRIPASGPTNGVSAPGTDAAKATDATARVLVISGSFPPHTPDDVLPALIGLGRDAGAIVIADTSGPALLAAADAGASVLKPNVHELADATGLDDPLDGARELLRRGAELVLLSQGADGMLAITAAPAGPAVSTSGADTPDVGRIPASGPTSGVSAPGTDAAEAPADGVSVLHARLDTALAGNPTGAGDAAVAACAVLMDAGMHDPEQVLRRATAWSAAAVLMPLAGEIHPSWPALEQALVVTPVPSLAAAPPAAAPPAPPAAGPPADSPEKPFPAGETPPGVASHAASDVSPASDPKDSR